MTNRIKRKICPWIAGLSAAEPERGPLARSGNVLENTVETRTHSRQAAAAARRAALRSRQRRPFVIRHSSFIIPP